MKKLIGFLKNNLLGIVIGFALCLTIDVMAATVISSSSVSYSSTSTSKTTVSGALDELFSAVDINDKIGTTSISNIGDGTVSGAISSINSNLNSVVNPPDVVNATVIKSDFAYDEKITYTIPTSGYYKLHARNSGTGRVPIAYIANETEAIIYDIDFGDANVEWSHASTEFLYFKAGTRVILRVNCTSSAILLYAAPMSTT